MTGELAGFDFRPAGADDERQRELEHMQAVMKRASDRLVDMTVPTPWERRREEAQDMTEAEDA